MAHEGNSNATLGNIWQHGNKVEVDTNYEIEQLRAEISQLEADVREAHGAARTSNLRQAMLQVHCLCLSASSSAARLWHFSSFLLT